MLIAGMASMEKEVYRNMYLKRERSRSLSSVLPANPESCTTRLDYIHSTQERKKICKR